ncbi:hypothetical protein F5B19DRAFT_291018 [Rostrohypoxylon terebratum]|nr:hypothetical protein F5B19DRAFT_291018 [Rostrohypoxylon terebratum]
MKHPSDSCIHPGILTQAPSNTSVYPFSPYDCTIEPHFQLQQPPMELTDNPLEFHQMSNISNVNPCVSQNDLVDYCLGADSDISRYITLPGDLHYQQSFPTQDYQNGGSQNSAGFSNRNKHESKLIKREDIPFATHGRRSSRSNNKLTSDESSLERRERNRKAANKCRKKQKQANEELKEKARVVDEQHNYLVSHKALLESEMIELKNELLIHGACGYEPISEYLTQAAQAYATGRLGNIEKAEQDTE